MPGPRMLTYNDTRLTLKEWAYRTGQTPQRLRNRLADGWTIARALTTPVKPYRTMAQALDAYLTQQEEEGHATPGAGV